MPDNADSAFTDLAAATLNGLLERDPVWATEVGDHRYDDRLTVGDAGHYGETSRWAARQLAALADVDASHLSAQNHADAQILRNRLELLLFSIDELREHEWDPMLANPSRGLYALLARDFAPLPERIRSAAHRLASVPQSLAAARAVLGQMPQLHIQTALAQFTGTEHLISNELAALAKEANGADGDMAEAAPAALAAIADHKSWLEQRLADGAQEGFRNPRLGPELFSRRLRLVLDTGLSAEQVLSRAEAALDQATEEITAAAAELAGRASNGDDVVRAVLNSLATDAPDDATILGFVRDAFAAQTRFVEANGLVTVFGDPIEVIEMPEIYRGGAPAYCDSPGPLETRPLPSFIAVAPTPEGWPPERVQSFWREYNRHMLHELVIHEGMPGHALHHQHIRRFTGTTPVRTVFWSLPLTEGWAVYAEQLMGARGFPGDGNPHALQMQRFKKNLTVAMNAIMDARVHCHGMTEYEAMALMTGPGYQEEGEATIKWRRALLTSARLSTYFVGYTEVSDLITGLRRAYPTWGDRQLHDAVLAHGVPPPRHLRTLLENPAGRG